MNEKLLVFCRRDGFRARVATSFTFHPYADGFDRGVASNLDAVPRLFRSQVSAGSLSLRR